MICPKVQWLAKNAQIKFKNYTSIVIWLLVLNRISTGSYLTSRLSNEDSLQLYISVVHMKNGYTIDIISL